MHHRTFVGELCLAMIRFSQRRRTAASFFNSAGLIGLSVESAAPLVIEHVDVAEQRTSRRRNSRRERERLLHFSPTRRTLPLSRRNNWAAAHRARDAVRIE